MIIQLSNGEVEIKSKIASCFCDRRLINQINISQPGEYEVADISAESYDGLLKVMAEGITVCYVSQAIDAKKNDLSDGLKEATILIMKLSNHSLSVSGAQALVRDIEPAVIIPVDQTLRDEFCHTIGGCGASVKSYKITKNQLSTDDQPKIVILS